MTKMPPPPVEWQFTKRRQRQSVAEYNWPVGKQLAEDGRGHQPVDVKIVPLIIDPMAEEKVARFAFRFVS
jgi:hypothetical protein